MASRRSFLRQTAAGAVAGLAASRGPLTHAQEGPMRVIVPFPPGGGTDILGRVIAAAMEDTMARPVVVENKPGASGMLGADYTANSAKDGSIVLFAGLVPSVRYYARPPEDLLKQLTPVCHIARAPYVIAVNADMAETSLAEFVARAKSEPNRVTFGTPGNATPSHIATELLQLTCGMDMLHVPYRGTGPMMTDLLGGQIQMALTTVAAAVPFLGGSRLRALAVTSAERLAQHPDIPTVAESGYPDFVAQIQYGTYAPAGTPADVVARLNDGINRALRAEAVRTRLGEQSFQPTGGTPQQLRGTLFAEINAVAKLVQAGKVRVDL